jgi:hypothetical protein
LRILHGWAKHTGLQPRETVYVSWTPSRHRLRFTKTGDENLERAYRTHWISPVLVAAKRQRQAEAERTITPEYTAKAVLPHLAEPLGEE